MGKQIDVLIKAAKEQGWEVERGKGNHYKWISPLGGFFFSSSTPSDHRAIKNLERDLRVRGFVMINKKERRKR
jgi:hypothetical protein